MLKRLCLSPILLALLFAPLAIAETGQEAEVTRVRAAIQELVANAQIDSITPAPVPGFYEVVLRGQIIYVSADGRYLMQGTLYDIAARDDLTERRRGGIRRAAMERVPSERRVVFGPEDARYRLAVFTDIDCGYCRRMHHQMEEYNALGITIEYLLFPRSGIGSQSHAKAVSVWCADDRLDAMTRAKNGEELPPGSCESPVNEHLELGASVGVTGTPALITADGTLIPGFLPPAQLLERLQQLEQVAQTAR